MVSLFQKDGFWWLNYRYKGERYRISTGTKDRKLAERKRQEYEVKLFKDINPIHEEPRAKRATIFDMFHRFLMHSEKSKAKTTWKTEKVFLKIWQEFFSRKRIKYAEQIDHSLITDFQIESEITPRSFNNALTLLRTVFNRAIDWGMLDKNPTRGFKKVKIPKKLKYFTDDELEELWSATSLRQQAIIALGAYAGLRNAEMINLKWRDIDFKNNTLEVRSDDEVTPKGKRPRSVPMHARLIEALKAYKIKDAGIYVFPRNDGRGPKCGRNGPSNEFRKLLRLTGIKGSHHYLRHSFGTRLVKMSVPLPVVQSLMGHADIESTMIYVHLHPTQNREAINTL